LGEELTYRGAGCGCLHQGVGGYPKTVTVTRPFLISDRDVSVPVFQEFIDDRDYPASGKPQDWEGVEKAISPTVEHRVQKVSWYGAVLFGLSVLVRKDRMGSRVERAGFAWDQRTVVGR
jgi:hypothetical protein